MLRRSSSSPAQDKSYVGRMIRHLNRELSEIKYQRDSVCGYLPIAGSKCFDISLLRNLNSHSTLCVSYIFCHKESVKGFELLNLLQIVISQVHVCIHICFLINWITNISLSSDDLCNLMYIELILV